MTVTLKQTCTCPCGSTAISVEGRVVTRLLCHCTICQSVYQKPYADVTVLWATAIQLPAERAIDYQRHRLPPALRRGTCPQCHAPVIGFLRLAPFVQLAFLPSSNFAVPTQLPQAAHHIFYHRRNADVSDDLPKISGYWPSELAVTRQVLASLMPN